MKRWEGLRAITEGSREVPGGPTGQQHRPRSAQIASNTPSTREPLLPLTAAHPLSIVPGHRTTTLQPFVLAAMFRTLRRLPGSAKRTKDFDLPCAKDSAYEVRAGGIVHLTEQTLEFADDAPSPKRRRQEEDARDEEVPTVNEPMEEHGEEVTGGSPAEPKGCDPKKKVRPGWRYSSRLDLTITGQWTPSSRMDEFKPHLETILSDMLWKDHDAQIPGPCTTAGCAEQATTRCRECRGKEPMCTACAVRGHRNLPFHWLDVWNGSYFDRHDLSDYGYELFLGHNGSPCPNIDYRDNATRLVVVHDNGIHNCQLRYCFCGGGMMKLSQLIRADLFPASLARIETAFTCEVLERFHLDYDISKRSSQDFVRVLSQLSARDAITGEVKVSFYYKHETIRELLIVVPGPLSRLHVRGEDIQVSDDGQAIWAQTWRGGAGKKAGRHHGAVLHMPDTELQLARWVEGHARGVAVSGTQRDIDQD